MPEGGRVDVAEDALAGLVSSLDRVSRALAGPDSGNGSAQNLGPVGTPALPGSLLPSGDRQLGLNLDSTLVDGVFASRSRWQQSDWRERSWNADALFDSAWMGIWSA